MRNTIFIFIISLLGLCVLSNCRHNDTPAQDTENDSVMSQEEVPGMTLDTMMFAAGHLFGCRWDVSNWGEWYYDTVYVGEDFMFSCDSIGPSRIRLKLFTRNMTIDIGDPGAATKIRRFLAPVDGFDRFRKRYEVCLDSDDTEGHGVLKCMGYISFIADCADSSVENNIKINQFIPKILETSGNNGSNVPPLTALYIGHATSVAQNKEYDGYFDFDGLAESLKRNIIEDWQNEGVETLAGSYHRDIDIRVRVANPRFITYCICDYDRIGMGHGMFTQTFASFDIDNGKRLTNRDIFRPNTSDKVKKALFEVMAKDSSYIEWNPEIKSAADVEKRIECWQSPDPLLDGTEWEEPEKNPESVLPEGALTNEGIVFSFQPYEIECWAAGAFHFLVPYKRVMPYLTPEAKRLISACNAGI